MNAARYSVPKHKHYTPDMRKAGIISAVLHLIVFVLATVGLPHFMTPPEPQEMALTVELVDVAEISQTPVQAPPEESEKQDAPAERKPVYNNTESVPDLASPQEPDVEDIPEPPKDKPKPDITKIKEPPKPKNKPRPKKKQAPIKPKPAPEKPEEEPKDEPERNIDSLLKSLTPDEPEDTQPTQQQTEEPEAGQTSQIADFSKDLTRSELDNLNAGVAPCWNVNAGGKYAEALVVTLRVSLNPDMTVKEAQILDTGRYNSNSHFRAAADAARRALLNPRCSKLRIPPEKYDEWKVFKYHFDPSQML